MDGIDGAVKNLLLRKVKSGQVVVYTPLELQKPLKRFVPSVNVVYLLQNEKISMQHQK